ncbi:MAG: bifunctional DNA-formamidopyrimidine glycosylase/DNA-(apurinic or apyrimidinic site) lyase [Bacteriovoracaceae bacterium]|nr:bifunctional DNA-formamidopyrimidine glycosylase/DNA-(apurinic or apyrimidinic site) lyase [Bacteriovoracaceae bacterium]
MPELPEVETVKRGLEEILGANPVIKSIKVLNPKLRFPVPKALQTKVKNQKILAVKRRAKYLIFELKDFILYSHLGMTGTWRVFENDRKKHDHIEIILKDGRKLTYCDPRKFGLFEYTKKDEDYHRLDHLGPEPLGTEFSFDYLWQRSRKKEVAIKNFIMDQKIVVGVGNIYAVESLFLSGIRPTRKTKNITKKECEFLIKNIKDTLKKAINAGGSTISDFKQAGGDSGYFQHRFNVYGKSEHPCPRCKNFLKNTVLGGRSSVWCPGCQK